MYVYAMRSRRCKCWSYQLITPYAISYTLNSRLLAVTFKVYGFKNAINHGTTMHIYISMQPILCARPFSSAVDKLDKRGSLKTRKWRNKITNAI